MILPKSLTNTTPLSKILAAILFITLPILGFYLGMEYEKAVAPDFTEVQPPVIHTTPKPETDPTANWKTYRNIEYGFSVDYPDNLAVVEAISAESYEDGLNNYEQVWSGDLSSSMQHPKITYKSYHKVIAVHHPF